MLNIATIISLIKLYAAKTSSNNSELKDEDQIVTLIETDMLPAVHDSNGAILCDENGNPILRY